MTTFPRSPRVLKGALVSVSLFNPLAGVIVFQYNPETLTRSLQPQIGGDAGGGRNEVLRINGAPIETINADVVIDATDQLEKRDPAAVRTGIYPQLSALEMLIFPRSSRIIANAALSLLGTIEVIPPEAPLTLFVWGVRRVVPVKLTSFSVTEEAYDVNLNPIRARVGLGMQVLTYDDLPLSNPGYGLFLANQVLRETMASLGQVNNLNSVVGGSPRLI